VINGLSHKLEIKKEGEKNSFSWWQRIFIWSAYVPCSCCFISRSRCIQATLLMWQNTH